MIVGYAKGNFDILRQKDLQILDQQIQLSKEEGTEVFGLGIYDSDLCENLGLSTPFKSIEDRMKIMQQIRGIDFVFPVHSLDNEQIETQVKKAYEAYEENLKLAKKTNKAKKYKIGYAPGTYDLFHAGHLENLLIAASQCDKLVVGVKANELVMEHKKRVPIIDAEERMEILRHFKVVDDVYKYYTRNPNIANEYIKSKYGESAVVFVGSDLEADFSKVNGLKIVYTHRDPELMKTRSTTAYRKLYLEKSKERKYTGNVRQHAGYVKSREENTEELEH